MAHRYTTQDVDIVHRTSTDNVNKLMTLFPGLEARVQNRASHDIKPDAALLSGTGQVNLTTTTDPPDLL